MSEISNLIYNVAYSLICVGIVIILFTLGTSSTGGVTGTMIGYCFIIIGMLLITGYLIKTIMPGLGLEAMFFTIGPFLMIISTILYILYLMGKYFDRITTGNVSGGYYTFSNISLILIILQLVVFYNATTSKTFKTDSPTLSKLNSMIIYLLGTINIISVATLGSILAYYITDGYTNLGGQRLN
jgi:hypothetical protein